MKRNSN